jgi:FSR family fosmidomycin resistance protein-like MFS transporter
VGVAAGHIVHDTYTGFLPAFLPIFISQMMLSKTEAGLLSVFAHGPSVIQPFIGHGADRTTRHGLYFLLPAFSAVIMSVLGQVNNYGLLAFLLIIVGLISAAFHAVVPVVAGRLSGRELGRGMSFWMVGGELGRALGPLIIVTAIQFFTLKHVPWLMVPGIITALILTYRMKDVHQYSPSAPKGLPWREALVRMRPVFLPVVGLIIVRGFMFAALTIYLPTYMTEQGSGLWVAGASLTMLQTAGVVGAFLGGTLSDRIGRRRILFITFITSAAVMFLFVSSSGALQIPLLIILGITLISTTPVIMAVVQENFPRNRALANGAFMSLSFVLRSIIVVIVGAMGDLIGLKIAFLASSVIILIGLPFVRLLPEKRG